MNGCFATWCYDISSTWNQVKVSIQTCGGRFACFWRLWLRTLTFNKNKNKTAAADIHIVAPLLNSEVTVEHASSEQHSLRCHTECEVSVENLAIEDGSDEDDSDSSLATFWTTNVYEIPLHVDLTWKNTFATTNMKKSSKKQQQKTESSPVSTGWLPGYVYKQFLLILAQNFFAYNSTATVSVTEKKSKFIF